MRAFAFLVAMAATTVSHAGPASITQITFRIQREADGKKYPNQVQESYTLGKDGTLQYDAYFGGMPIDMNHNDSATWKSGAAGKRVLATTKKLVRDLVHLPDDKPAPNGGMNVYLVTVTIDHADSTRYARDAKSKAWKLLHPQFQALIAQFEKATGRPKKPGDLPQR